MIRGGMNERRGSAPRSVASEGRHATRLALLLAAAALTTCVIGARAGEVLGGAAGQWDKGVRDQAKSSALRIEGEIYVYGDPVARAIQFQKTRIRADELLDELAGPDVDARARDLLKIVANVERSRADDAEKVLADDATFVDASGDYAFELARRIDAEQQESRAVSVTAGHDQSAGDELSRRALLEALAAVPAAVAFLLASIAQARRREPTTFVPALGATMVALSLAAAVALELGAAA